MRLTRSRVSQNTMAIVSMTEDEAAPPPEDLEDPSLKLDIGEPDDLVDEEGSLADEDEGVNPLEYEDDPEHCDNDDFHTYT